MRTMCRVPPEFPGLLVEPSSESGLTFPINGVRCGYLRHDDARRARRYDCIAHAVGGVHREPV